MQARVKHIKKKSSPPLYSKVPEGTHKSSGNLVFWLKSACFVGASCKVASMEHCRGSGVCLPGSLWTLKKPLLWVHIFLVCYTHLCLIVKRGERCFNDQWGIVAKNKNKNQSASWTCILQSHIAGGRLLVDLVCGYLTSRSAIHLYTEDYWPAVAMDNHQISSNIFRLHQCVYRFEETFMFFFDILFKIQQEKSFCQLFRDFWFSANRFLVCFLNFSYTSQVGSGKTRRSFLILPSVNSVKPGDTCGLFFYSAAAKNFWQATFGLRNFSKLSKTSDCIKNP